MLNVVLKGLQSPFEFNSKGQILRIYGGDVPTPFLFTDPCYLPYQLTPLKGLFCVLLSVCQYIALYNVPCVYFSEDNYSQGIRHNQ